MIFIFEWYGSIIPIVLLATYKEYNFLYGLILHSFIVKKIGIVMSLITVKQMLYVKHFEGNKRCQSNYCG